jgi:hypothetical protein
MPVPERGRPWHFKYLTVRHIYHPLAQSSGKILELLKALKAADGDRKKRLFQFLNDVGTRALRMHLGRVLEMAESSPDRYTYERKIVQRFGGQQELDLYGRHRRRLRVRRIQMGLYLRQPKSKRPPTEAASHIAEVREVGGYRNDDCFGR